MKRPPDWDGFAAYEQTYGTEDLSRADWQAKTVAALSEGFCPIHKERTVQRAKRPQAETTSYCASCNGRWATYTDPDGYPDFFSFGDD